MRRLRNQFGAVSRAECPPVKPFSHLSLTTCLRDSKFDTYKKPQSDLRLQVSRTFKMAESQSIFHIRPRSVSSEEEDTNAEVASPSYYTAIGTNAPSSCVTLPDVVFFRPGEDVTLKYTISWTLRFSMHDARHNCSHADIAKGLSDTLPQRSNPNESQCGYHRYVLFLTRNSSCFHNCKQYLAP